MLDENNPIGLQIDNQNNLDTTTFNIDDNTDCNCSTTTSSSDQTQLPEESISSTANDSTATLFSYTSRSGWNASTPRLIEHFDQPAKYVIIHHSYRPSHCVTTSECIQAMLNMQRYHMEGRGWNDIGYSFAVGGDGLVYQGRGFQTIAAHAPGYNARSVGICVIGDWRCKFQKSSSWDWIYLGLR